jgi:hypothetical protein
MKVTSFFNYRSRVLLEQKKLATISFNYNQCTITPSGM